MIRISMMILTALLLQACATRPGTGPESLTIVPAPISFDGNVAGKPTDLVFVLVPDADPAVPGVALAPGERLEVSLPVEFARNDQVAIRPNSNANLILTKGWPQGAVKQAGQYEIYYNAASHSIGVNAPEGVLADGANAPGIKGIHVRGRTFMNPFPADAHSIFYWNYSFEVKLIGADGRPKRSWSGRMTLLEHAPSARLASTNFHLAPGEHADFQKIGVNQPAPSDLGLLLWDEFGSALDGVGIAPRDLRRFPKYTGGLLVQDTSGDRRLDPAVDRVVGGIIGAAPKDARGQLATSPIRGDGSPVLSGEAVRHAGYSRAAGGGEPNPGLMPIRFRAGDKAGLYRPTIELLDGNSYQFTIEAR